MAYSQFISLNEVGLKFNIEFCWNNKYSLSAEVNGIKYKIGEFEYLGDIHTAFLNIMDDFDNGMTELYCQERWAVM